jgi:ATP-binding cassette, subfamily B (MDR/TAP), member 1
VTCTIEKGKTTAFVGPSGSGKSTIVKLIERFYDPDEGAVMIGNQDLRKLNLRDYRHKIGYVGQEPVLFNESIKSNMLNAKPDATEEEMIEALKQANAYKFVERLKLGLETNAGASGGQLSGGEKQRIAVARAFLKKPDVLILDEATSALDRRNEAEVQAAIDAINKKTSITTIVIAHRLSTIKKADKIIVLEKGEVKEVGDHISLLRDYPDGVYSGLVQTQEMGDEEDSKEPDLLEEEDEGSKHSINSSKNKKQEDINQTPNMEKKLSDNYSKKYEKELTKEIDKEDEKREDEIKATRLLRKKKGFFKRLVVHNKPPAFIFTGLVASILVGTLFPVFAVVWTKVLFVMMQDPDDMFRDLLKYCGFLLLIGAFALITVFIDKFSFGFISENMSRNIREECYRNIFRKHVGWFDLPENTTGQLTNVLSTDVNTLNGASTESIGIMFQAMIGLITGITLALIYEWRICLVALAIAPIMMISAAINSKVKAGSLVNIDKSGAKTYSMVSDSIINYATVASFANEATLIEKFKQSLQGKLDKEIRKCYISGVLFGFSQFMQFGMYTVLFWSGAKFVEKYDINPQHLFTAIYVMMFAAIGAGQAQQHGPSAGKAIESACKIYDIIDEPSEIDPFVTNLNEIIASKENIKGEIEFRDVWFRYPTRKDHWVLKGLNMKIYANE